MVVMCRAGGAVNVTGTGGGHYLQQAGDSGYVQGTGGGGW
jgi:hypothetical protein